MLQAAAAMLITATPHIVRAAETADDNRRKCRQLDDRAHYLRAIVRAREDRGGVTEPVWTKLQMLKAAVEGAIQLVKSCRRRENGLVAWAQDLLASESMSTKLQEADNRITACIGDLNFVERYEARPHDDRRRAARVEAAPKQQRYHAQPARRAPPPPPLQRITAPPPPRQQRHVVQPAGSMVAVAPLRRHHRGVVQHRNSTVAARPRGLSWCTCHVAQLAGTCSTTVLAP